MTKTPDVEVVPRINTAMALLGKGVVIPKLVKRLVRRYGVSGRQAYRYIIEAQKSRRPLPIPEQKIVFTVKLPLSLARRLRELAKLRKESLSNMVTHALEVFLKRVRNGS